MKRNNFLKLITVPFFITILILSSCNSSKKASVSCPDFPDSRFRKENLSNRLSRHKKIIVHRPSGYKSKQPVINAFASKLKRNRLFNEPYEPYDGLYYSSDDHLNVQHPVMPEYVTGRSDLSETGFIHTADIITGKHKQNYLKNEIKNVSFVTEQAEGCDTVVLRKGDIIIVRILEVGHDQVKYKKCNNLDGPVYSLGTSEVSVIKYNNGTRDFFSQSSSSNYVEIAPVKKTDGFALASFICGIGGLIIFGIPLGILAVVFGAMGTSKIQKYPDKLSGKGFAVAGIVLGIIDVVGVLLILASM